MRLCHTFNAFRARPSSSNFQVKRPKIPLISRRLQKSWHCFIKSGYASALCMADGKQLSDLASRLGIEQTIINGRRVTDDATLEMAKMIFAGKINTDILAALRNYGVEAVGLSGVDGNTVHAARRPVKEVLNRETGKREDVDFGHVGDIVEINSRLLNVLLDHGYLPIVSSLGADDDGKVFNINADTIATEIAVQLQAEKLILLTDVDGICSRQGEPETKLSRLTADEAEALIRDGVATGGMIPKLQSIVTLLRRGVRSAHIINGTLRNALFSEVFTTKEPAQWWSGNRRFWKGTSEGARSREGGPCPRFFPYYLPSFSIPMRAPSCSSANLRLSVGKSGQGPPS